MYISFASVLLNREISYLCGCGNGVFQTHLTKNYGLCSCVKCKELFSFAVIGGKGKGNTSCLSKATKYIKSLEIVDIYEELKRLNLIKEGL